MLAQSKPYDSVFNLPFKTVVLSTFTFANGDQVLGMAASPDRQKAEEAEFYQLAKYLYSHFAGSGKTFVLKNWEGDWAALGQGNTTGNISENTVQDMIAWLSARGESRAQRGGRRDRRSRVQCRGSEPCAGLREEWNDAGHQRSSAQGESRYGHLLFL
jgi:hypothetical protein